MPFAADRCQPVAAMLERPPGVANGGSIDEAVMPGNHISLNVPVVEKELVGPDLRSRSVGNGRFGNCRLDSASCCEVCAWFIRRDS